MVEEALILDIDIIEYEHRKELERAVAKERERVRKESRKTIDDMAGKLRSLGVSEKEIADLAGITKE